MPSDAYGLTRDSHATLLFPTSVMTRMTTNKQILVSAHRCITTQTLSKNTTSRNWNVLLNPRFFPHTGISGRITLLHVATATQGSNYRKNRRQAASPDAHLRSRCSHVVMRLLRPVFASTFFVTDEADTYFADVCILGALLLLNVRS